VKSIVEGIAIRVVYSGCNFHDLNSSLSSLKGIQRGYFHEEQRPCRMVIR